MISCPSGFIFVVEKGYLVTGGIMSGEGGRLVAYIHY